MEKPNLTLKQLVQDNKAYFDFYRQGIAYYKVTVEDKTYRFPVRLDDIADATLLAEEKAILLMRYIRKAMDSNELVTV